MKPKFLFQIFALLILLFGTIGTGGPAQAQAITGVPDGAVIVIRQVTYWDATFAGNVDAQRYEKWSFVLSEAHSFVVTATPTTTGLTALIRLLDGNGNEIARGTGVLTSNEPSGTYFALIQPEAGSGSYNLTLRQASQDQQPSVSTVVTPPTVNAGGTAMVSVNLNNVPADGYASVEFTCTYNASLSEASNIAVAGLFGTDPVLAVNGPGNGSFIAAIAGSNGNKATTSGPAFTFNLKGLQAGQTAVECKARVSNGDNSLVDISSTAGSLTINGLPPTPTSSPTATPTFTPTPAPTSSPTPTTVVPVSVTLTGKVLASKPVTVRLYDANNLLAASMSANADGSFSLSAPAGMYTVVATASGFLSAQGSANLTGSTVTKPTISLIAGDIDGNHVIDQYDALTIGMGYNTAVPAAADLNNDGIINVLDLQLLAANYRKSGALSW